MAAFSISSESDSEGREIFEDLKSNFGLGWERGPLKIPLRKVRPRKWVTLVFVPHVGNGLLLSVQLTCTQTWDIADRIGQKNNVGTFEPFHCITGLS